MELRYKTLLCYLNRAFRDRAQSMLNLNQVDKWPLGA